MLPGAPVQPQPHSSTTTDSGDPTLATEILPGPPSIASVQQVATKRDPRKPGPIVSFLPQHDPGTTYTGFVTGPVVGSLERTLEVEGPRRKRARVDKGLNVANPSADNGGVTEAAASAILDILDSDPFPTAQDSDGPTLSRSNSISYIEDPALAPAISHPSRKIKGKQKVTVRVKEEPTPVTLQMTDSNSSFFLRNEDHCSACRSLGSLVYCDGCPRAYHLWCLDPPMEQADLPEGDKRCTDVHKQHPPPKPSPSFMSPLIQHLQNSLPVEFQLPEDVRTFFKSVGTSARGTYVDTSTVKPPRLKCVSCLLSRHMPLTSDFATSHIASRHGQLEERDPYRTKDRNGEPVLCYHCATSALPDGMAVTAPAAKRPRRSTVQSYGTEHWRSIVSCDYCPNHWHLDCLDPPLMVMPPFDKKWMCPLHAEHTTRPKHRIPKQNAPPIEITKPDQINNGNIEVTNPQPTSVDESKVAVDEVFINGRRYRVPERIIQLDFWNKLNKERSLPDQPSIAMSGMSSPLTSLSSLEEIEDPRSIMLPPQPATNSLPVDDLRTALMLLDMRSTTSQSSTSTPEPMNVVTTSIRRMMIDDSVQTDAVPPTRPGSSAQRKVSVPTKLPAQVKAVKLKPPAPPKSGAHSKSSASSRAPIQAGLAFESDLSVQSGSSVQSECPVQTKRGGKRPAPAASLSSQPEPKIIKAEPTGIDLGSKTPEGLLSAPQVERKTSEPERKQPARASKRDVKYVRTVLSSVSFFVVRLTRINYFQKVIHLDFADSADEASPFPSTSALALMEVDSPSQTKMRRPPGRPRKSKPMKRNSSKSRGRAKDAAAKPLGSAHSLNGELSSHAPGTSVSANPIIPPISIPSLATSSAPRTAPVTFAPAVSAPAPAPAQSSTPTLKIRLPARVGGGTAPTPKAVPTAPPSPVASKTTQARSRRSLRRQNSTPASTSTAASRLESNGRPASPTP
ncbi:hypothetical protein EW146_g4662 [Bondarzewia mesenterica]|uniref:Zinc finger PHD-type domain-containing protein n=1 Tax=Bondarzewia mesenterica TaxID=1095465 RepID=A0A4S4LUX3_9AGAM|nr:hypothetical protein EW146_g4662 [Bondarzewia mesenterica]